ncbi:bifunctional methylenetetrahydrofolate dehydrogenase/methenyltetrahydrofolate cyclohydrolase [Auraticoccus cholistanensis]|uniref:bifunctional methylenetetrahydrofolate dehydrogenase/methenyltetrahydrofolate cyclohydrolase n=1 Tax=Auraticoccus cholistanensis TaxID=2656650 RepID=UPI0018D26311
MEPAIRTTVVDPSEVAERFRADIREQVRERGRRLRIVGLLTQQEGPARTYAQYARRGAENVGMEMELWELAPRDVLAAIRRANEDETVDGIFLYYPLVDPAEDRWLRELVDPRKDVEGMHSFWSRLLYENRRYLDEERTRRTIVPCTPLAILKLLDETGLRRQGVQAPLEGVTACVINRSEVVGRPLSAMLANDGATVVSLDLTGSVVFDPAIGRHTHSVRDAEITRAQALAGADVVITGVPSREFPLVTAAEIAEGAICVNFSQFRNFDDSIMGRASAFVPRVGPMTVTMATRNLLRLVELQG